jgi:three-Cys-motif partner protein
MSRRSVEGRIPAAYIGKEPGYIKHELLKTYLEQLVLIIGMAADRLGVGELCYVDCFAGPWKDESSDLSSTSIATSLQILDKCRRELDRQRHPMAIRALYVERNPASFARLDRYLATKCPAGISAEAKEGDFVELRKEILKWCGDGAFCFFFVDPTQWTPASVKVLAPLLKRERSEFLINFMYDFLNRAMSMADFRLQMRDLLGEVPSVEDLHGWVREQKILSTYRRNLKQQMPASRRYPPRSAYIRVLDATKERTKYHLVYLTTHPHGIIVFMQASEKLEPLQKLVRAETKQRARVERTGQSELFSASEVVDSDADIVDIKSVENDWLVRLSKEPRKFDEAAFATLMEETDWLPGDLQRALGNLIKAGRVRNLDSDGKRRLNFLHFKGEGEHLQLVVEAT